jgi:hypothetical protein
MPISLSKTHRKLLENTTAAARVLAESACRAALENLAVHEKEYRSHMTVEQRTLRNRLRARGRALGDARDPRTGVQEIRHLFELAAYEHWHRLLFTRFLTENHLLITDESHGSVPITLEECEELATELGARDGQELACRFASRTLPGVFRRDDPVLDLPLALNDQVEMRKLLATLPPDCFRADDALGWTYQFWQTQRKNEINDSGKKIGADELAPVTQLFTEDYMVEFLLHNALGAWWAGKHGPIKAASEEEARAQVGLHGLNGVPAIAWIYLRFVQDEVTNAWVPAAGVFDAWPKSAKLICLLDPCMGSGHFLVFALPLLVRLRIEEEKLSPQAAVVEVLKDNIFGLELDERCTQIAAFNLALTAWKFAGYQVLPPLHLACSGLSPSGTEAEWMALAGKDDRLRRGMMRLHSLFKDAPVLGSLINPRLQAGDLIEAEFHELAPLLADALAAEERRNPKLDVDAAELAVVAKGLAKAADLLARQFTLVATNVPFLGRLKQDKTLREFSAAAFSDTKADLATCFIERCVAFCVSGGATTLVAPQNTLFLSTYREFRERLLKEATWNAVVRLGEHSFESQSAAGAFIVFITLTKCAPTPEQVFVGIDVSAPRGQTPIFASEKAELLAKRSVVLLRQSEQLKNPGSVVTFSEPFRGTLLSKYADSYQGAHTYDINRFRLFFWEMDSCLASWNLHSSSPSGDAEYTGYHYVSFKRDDDNEFGRIIKEITNNPQETRSVAWKAGNQAWGKTGVACAWMGTLPVSLYVGCVFDNSVSLILPRREEHLLPIWTFCSSVEFRQEVRKINQKVQVTNATLVQVPFDLAFWQKMAIEKYPDGLPKPHSADPTQWLFNGHPKHSDQSLHVAVARLLGYRWPRQTGSGFPDCPAFGPDGLEKFAGKDGIVCLPPLVREQPAAARLRQLLTAALGTFDERALIASAGLKGSKSKTLEDWLRDEFFEQHAKLFLDRPFIWHLWDGRADGFNALVNYHHLGHATLQKLTYSYLGNWIQHQAEDAKADKPGAAERLGAALALQAKLAAILEGETPLDIFVRWKTIKEQAQGWHPDLNDGIRQNIRPFLLAGDVGKNDAGLFRSVPLVFKDKDRGAESQRLKKDYPWFWCEEEPGTDPVGGKEFIGNRWNAVHLTLETKQRARE